MFNHADHFSRRRGVANIMSTKNQKSVIALGLIAALLVASASAQETNGSRLPSTSATTTTVAQAAPIAAPTIRTAAGIVRGVTQGEVSSFKGIPYAAAPVGAY